jgi:hypothetical protein
MYIHVHPLLCFLPLLSLVKYSLSIEMDVCIGMGWMMDVHTCTYGHENAYTYTHAYSYTYVLSFFDTYPNAYMYMPIPTHIHTYVYVYTCAH